MPRPDRSPRRYLWILTIAVALRASKLHAEPDKDDDTLALPEILVTGQRDPYNPETTALPKYTQPILDTPQSIIVVPQQVIQDQGATTMKDVLRNVAGISLAAGEGSSQGDNLTIRGFTARSDFYLDGMRDFGNYFRDPFNLQQVDVLEGPNSIMFGRGSTGGIVNQESKTARLDNFDQTSFALGSDNTRRVTADINHPLVELGPTAAFRMNVMGDEGNVAGRNVVQNSRYGFAPTLAWGLGTPTRATLSYLHQSESDVPDYGIPWLDGSPAPVNRSNFYGFTSDYLKTDVDVVTGKIEHDVNDNLTLRDQLRYANYGRHMRSTEPDIPSGTPLSTPLSSIQVTRNELVVDSNETNVDNQADATYKVETGPLRHTMVGGFEIIRETSDPTRTTYTGVPTVGLLDPDDGQQFTGTAAPSSVVHAEIDTLAVYAMEDVKLGEKWEGMGGIRYDRADSYYNQTVAPAASFSQIDNMPSWRGALIFKPKPNGSVYFSAGTSFDPSAEQLSLSAATVGLPPEQSKTYEVGSKWDLFGGALTLDGAVFRDEMLNARETDPDNPLLNILSGDQRVDGFQLGMTGKITDKWQAFAGYMFMDTRVISSVINGEVGRPLANAPANTATFWSTYKLPWESAVGLGANGVSRRYASTTPGTSGGDVGYIGEAPGYVVFNAMAKKELGKRLSIQVDVFNLLDKYYYDGIHPSHIVPGAARSALVTANFKF